jgi:hypothetical protein
MKTRPFFTLRVFRFGWLVWVGLHGSTFGQAPSFIEVPANRAVPEGSTVYLTASMAGELPMTYTWFRNYRMQPYYQETLDSTNCTLVLTNMTPDTAAYFWLNVSNAKGNAPTKFITVAVISSGRETNGFGLTISGWSNSVWQVDCKTNLQDTGWVILTNFTIPTRNPFIKFVDTEGTNANRFYRVVSLDH